MRCQKGLRYIKLYILRFWVCATTFKFPYLAFHIARRNIRALDGSNCQQLKRSGSFRIACAPGSLCVGAGCAELLGPEPGPIPSLRPGGGGAGFGGGGRAAALAAAAGALPAGSTLLWGSTGACGVANVYNAAHKAMGLLSDPY